MLFPEIIKAKVITKDITLYATEDLKRFFFINRKGKAKESIIYPSEESAYKAYKEDRIEWNQACPR